MCRARDRGSKCPNLFSNNYMRVVSIVCLLLAALPAPAQPRTAPIPDSERTRWFRDSKFGIFVHWGAYSVIGRHEWARHKLQIPQAEYDKFVRQFNPVKFNAAEWTNLFRSAGAKYVVITSKHHDGFSIYRSRVSDYDMELTPYPGDPLKQLAEAALRAAKDLPFLIKGGESILSGKTDVTGDAQVFQEFAVGTLQLSASEGGG